MALSADDKLLGEKTHYYCSSSEEEGNTEEDGSDDEIQQNQKKEPTFIPERELSDYKGYSTNTGPKGVINDWRRFKQLETEKRQEQEAERIQLMKKLSLTCRSEFGNSEYVSVKLDDEVEKKKDEHFTEEIEEDFDEFEEEFLKLYRQKRIEEMRHSFCNVKTFGHVIELTTLNFLEEIEKDGENVVVVHLYDKKLPACVAMNMCLSCLAREYTGTKFCTISAPEASMSFAFSRFGVPALLVYKKGELIGNFVRVTKDLGEDFFASDVESFLQEHGFLPNKDTNLGSIRSNTDQVSDSDSDFDID